MTFEISSTGSTAPISLFTYMTETKIVSSLTAWASSSREGPWQAERKLSKAPEDTTLWPFRSARCRALRSARGQLGFIST